MEIQEIEKELSWFCTWEDLTDDERYFYALKENSNE
jgi:hypothetical protein